MPRSHLHVKPSRNTPRAMHAWQFSRHWLGCGYLVAVTGSSWENGILSGRYGVYVHGALYQLARAQNKNMDLHGDIPPISFIVACRRTCFAGHCFRAKDQIISDVISLRLPCPKRGRRPPNYTDCIVRDIGHELADMQTSLMSCMSDRDTWRGIQCTLSWMRPPSSSIVVVVVVVYRKVATYTL